MQLAVQQAPVEQAQGPSVTIARRVVEAAGAFERYVRTTAAISPDFDGAPSVSAAVMASAGYEPRQLEQGAVAYAALVALQEPTFANGLSRLASDPSGRAAFAEHLIANPDQVLDVPGARQAAGLASAALGRLGMDLLERGRGVKQAAYTVQRQPWSLQPIDDPASRMSQVKSVGQSPGALTEAETQQLLTRVVAHRNDAGVVPDQAPTPTIVRGLALAAAAFLGQAGDERAESLTPLLSDPGTSNCLKMAKLNLHQCLAVAGPQYEDVYCAGEYAMAQTGQCIVNAAHVQSAAGVLVPVSGGRATMAVSVPVALGPAAQPASAAPVGAEAQAAYAPRSADTAATTASAVEEDRPATAAPQMPSVWRAPTEPAGEDKGS